MKQEKPKKDAPRPNADDVLRRMLATAPDPRITKKKKAKESSKKNS